MKKDLITLSILKSFIQVIIDNGHFDRYLIELHKIYELMDSIIENTLEEMKQEEIKK
nr:MAG TPA: hypothetical protein [Caudoviricetes sp.]